MNQEKKSIFKKWWFWVLAVIVILGGNESDNKVEKPAAIESAQTVKEKPAIAKPKLDENAIMAIAKAASQNNFDNVDIKKTTNGSTLYNVLITSKGFTQTTLHYNPNSSKAKKAYDKVVKNMQDLCKTYNKLLVDNGLCGNFIINIMNDENTKNVLLMTTENTVIYSAYE